MTRLYEPLPVRWAAVTKFGSKGLPPGGVRVPHGMGLRAEWFPARVHDLEPHIDGGVGMGRPGTAGTLPVVLSAGLLFVVILVAAWIFIVILGVALRFRHLLRRKDR